MTTRAGVARGLLVGRFQPFHLGHLAVVRAIRAEWPAEPLILAIGSAQSSHTPENPFTAAERFEMIERALRSEHVEGCLVLPLPDVGRHAVWVAHTEELLPPFGRVHTNNPLTRALFERAGYRVEAPRWVDRARFEGRLLRSAMREGGDWSSGVPPVVADYLREIDAPARMRLATSEPGGGNDR